MLNNHLGIKQKQSNADDTLGDAVQDVHRNILRRVVQQIHESVHGPHYHINAKKDCVGYHILGTHEHFINDEKHCNKRHESQRGRSPARQRPLFT